MQGLLQQVDWNSKRRMQYLKRAYGNASSKQTILLNYRDNSINTVAQNEADVLVLSMAGSACNIYVYILLRRMYPAGTSNNGITVSPHKLRFIICYLHTTVIRSGVMSLFSILLKPYLACGLFLLVFCLAYSSTLMMEAICSSQTSGYLRTTGRYNSQDRTLHSVCLQDRTDLYGPTLHVSLPATEVRDDSPGEVSGLQQALIYIAVCSVSSRRTMLDSLRPTVSWLLF
jgi:hypothetical protein